jgi:hypothetical protein
MQGMAMNPAAFAQMAAVSAPATAVPGMQGKMGTPVRPANMQTMVAGAMPGWYTAPTAVQADSTGIHAACVDSCFALQQANRESV